MEYLVLLAVLAAFVIIVFVREAAQAKERDKRFADSLYQDFGKLPNREYSPESYAHIPAFFERHRQDGQLDDVTWNDLEMDDIFKRMNYAFSASGEEYLYYMLRTPRFDEEKLLEQERAAAWFGTHSKERVRLQVLMREVGHTGKYSLYDYIENLDYLGERSNRKHHLMNALFLALIAFAPFQLSISLFGTAVLIAFQIVRYLKEKGEIEPYIISFAYVLRLMDACGKICDIPLPECGAQVEKMRHDVARLGKLKKGSFWLFSSGSSKTSGSPLDVVMDYVRMIFHVDLIVFNRMLQELREHLADVDDLIAQAGYLEAAVCVSAFRASAHNGWCVPAFSAEDGSALTMTQGYHPLLDKPVKNTIRADRGVLLTGSNASGKSTFLKTVALNAVLAQTIHTCTAENYRAPFFRILTSMALRDDLQGGESYYIVEIKALKRILDEAGKGRMLCLVDEVLRGTNTVERIAASTEILKSLGRKDILCFAATHDIELTELLTEFYDNYHFEEDIREGDVCFPYQLLAGKAVTRNAIRLLEAIGYEKRIVEQAFERARRFEETGIWRA